MQARRPVIVHECMNDLGRAWPGRPLGFGPGNPGRGLSCRRRASECAAVLLFALGYRNPCHSLPDAPLCDLVVSLAKCTVCTISSPQARACHQSSQPQGGLGPPPARPLDAAPPAVRTALQRWNCQLPRPMRAAHTPWSFVSPVPCIKQLQPCGVASLRHSVPLEPTSVHGS